MNVVTYSRIEQPSADAEEDPDVYHERKCKYKCNVLQSGNVKASGFAGSRVLYVILRPNIGYLCSTERKEKEHKGANELAKCSNKVFGMVSSAVRECFRMEFLRFFASDAILCTR